MSVAHKCDRCQGLYEDQVGNVRLDAYHIVTKVEEDGATAEGWQADLCPPCSELFLEFIKHKENAQEAG